MAIRFGDPLGKAHNVPVPCYKQKKIFFLNTSVFKTIWKFLYNECIYLVKESLYKSNKLLNYVKMNGIYYRTECIQKLFCVRNRMILKYDLILLIIEWSIEFMSVNILIFHWELSPVATLIHTY